MSDQDMPPLPGDALPPSAPPDAAPAAALALAFGPPWQEQDGLLRDLWLQNKTPAEISDILGRSVAAIMTRAARLGLPRRSAPGRKPGSRRLPDQEQASSAQSRAAQPRTVAQVLRGGADGAPQPSARICLMCLRGFQSLGRHNRICGSCKGSSEYESAAAMADIHLPV